MLCKKEVLNILKSCWNLWDGYEIIFEMQVYEILKKMLVFLMGKVKDRLLRLILKDDFFIYKDSLKYI